jgi:hypothetical protein
MVNKFVFCVCLATFSFIGCKQDKQSNDLDLLLPGTWVDTSAQYIIRDIFVSDTGYVYTYDTVHPNTTYHFYETGEYCIDNSIDILGCGSWGTSSNADTILFDYKYAFKDKYASFFVYEKGTDYVFANSYCDNSSNMNHTRKGCVVKLIKSQ